MNVLDAVQLALSKILNPIRSRLSQVPSHVWVSASLVVIVGFALVLAMITPVDPDDPTRATSGPPPIREDSPPEISPILSNPDASPSSAARRIASPLVVSQGTRSPSPNTSPTSDDSQAAWKWDSPDGKPGWSKPFGGCSQGSVPVSSSPPHESLDLELILPRLEYRSGEVVEAELEVTNRGLEYVEFESISWRNDGTLLDESGGALSGARYSDAISVRQWRLVPFQSSRKTVRIRTSMCGDTSAGPEPGLSPGSYQIVAWLNLDSSHSWIAPQKTIHLLSN